MARGQSVDGWKPERLRFIGIALAFPSSPRPWARESSMFLYSLNARMAFFCKSRGLATSIEIAEGIATRSRIISIICPFRELCFRREPRHFAEQFVCRGSCAMKYVHLQTLTSQTSSSFSAGIFMAVSLSIFRCALSISLGTRLSHWFKETSINSATANSSRTTRSVSPVFST
jgi:hypothetical protein